jgi:phage baseplate assembly protein W
MTTTKFIGKGIVFPIQLNQWGRPDSVSDLTLIYSSIAMILNWPKFTRFFNERFGARMAELLEEPNDGVTRSLARSFIIEGLAQHEKRINVLDVTVESHDLYKVFIKISFRVRNTKIEDTYIFPYYKIIT